MLIFKVKFHLKLRVKVQNQVQVHENKKPGFSSYVPVDTSGKLISPKDAGIIAKNPTELNAQSEWKFGDGAPVENAFMLSSTYQYALQKVLNFIKITRLYKQKRQTSSTPCKNY